MIRWPRVLHSQGPADDESEKSYGLHKVESMENSPVLGDSFRVIPCRRLLRDDTPCRRAGSSVIER